MFKSPPKKPGKRHTKSMPMGKHGEPLVNGSNLDQKFSYSSRPDTGGGGGVGPGGDDEGGVIRNRSSNSQSHNQNSSRYRRRTADDFLMFCQFILDYTKYDQMKQQDLRRRHSSSPSLGSTGSGNESLPRSSTSGANDLEEVDDEDDSDDHAQRRLARLQTPTSKRMTLLNKKESHRSRKSLGKKFGDGVAAKDAIEDEAVEDEEEDDFDDDDDDDEEEGEDWDQVTCYCGRPFAGRPMIECTRCLTWVHLKCAKLTRQRIPETWFCQKCKSLKGNDEIAERKNGIKKSTTIKGKKTVVAMADAARKSSPTKMLTSSSSSTSNGEKISGSRKRKSTSRRQKFSSVTTQEDKDHAATFYVASTTSQSTNKNRRLSELSNPHTTEMRDEDDDNA